MRISYTWLKDLVDLRESPQDIANRLTHVGLALEAIDRIGVDSVIDFDVPPNRPDCLSHLGIAREVAAIYGVPLREPSFEVPEGNQETTSVVSISIADTDLCMRYCGRYIAGVRIGPSPEWLRTRLEGLGVRSINNVADVTNLVMLELGQPLHAFDADGLHGGQIVVRRAGIDEKITTLDGVERVLNPSILVIADADRPVAIAGLMGGTDTEISRETKNVLLESAAFDPLSIRKASRTIGLASEASHRFERGSDVEMARRASDRAAAMIQQLAGGTVYRGEIDVYPVRIEPATVTLRQGRIQAFLGALVDNAIVEGIFQRLGFKVTSIPGGWTVEAPSFRRDIVREEDLLEEIARHHGFDKFPMTLPAWSGVGAALPYEREERRLRNVLAGCGYTEMYTYSFSDEATERQFRPDIAPVKLQNPMTEDGSILRTSLVPGMLKTILWNLNRGIRDLQFYELSRVYSRDREYRSLIIAGCGALRPNSVHESQREFNFYDLKGDIEALTSAFDLLGESNSLNIPGYYHPGRACRMGDLVVFGEIHPEYAEMFKLRQRVYIAEIEVEQILPMKSWKHIQAVPRFPAIRRDFSLLVDKGTQYAAVKQTIAGIGISEVARIEPFDRMEAGPFADTQYSLSISVIYQSAERTLTDAEVEGFDQKILQTLKHNLGAQLRK